MSTKKQLIIAGIVAVSILVIFNVYWFGVKSVLNNQYQKGVDSGKAEVIGSAVPADKIDAFMKGIQAGQVLVINQIVTELNQAGQLTLTLPTATSTQTVILVPEVKK